MKTINTYYIKVVKSYAAYVAVDSTSFKEAKKIAKNNDESQGLKYEKEKHSFINVPFKKVTPDHSFEKI